MEIPDRKRLLRKKKNAFCHSSSLSRHTYPSMRVPPFSTSPISHYRCMYYSRVQSPSTLPLLFFPAPRAILLPRLATCQFGYPRDSPSRIVIDIHVYFATSIAFLSFPFSFPFLFPFFFLVGVSCDFCTV